MNLLRRLSTRNSARGQNLIELALTLPFIIILIFFISDLGRAWWTYNAAKMAVNDAVHTAAMKQNASAGQARITQLIGQANLTGSGTVSQIPNQHAYQANITVQFIPVFAGMSIPTPGGSIKIIPNAFPITYSQVSEASVY